MKELLQPNTEDQEVVRGTQDVTTPSFVSGGYRVDIEAAKVIVNFLDKIVQADSRVGGLAQDSLYRKVQILALRQAWLLGNVAKRTVTLVSGGTS